MSEKQMNQQTGKWEVDGVPVTYQVTWNDVDTGEKLSREFDDIDQGYEYYGDKQRSPRAVGVTWQHLPW